MLEDNRGEPRRKASYRLPVSLADDVGAIADALGISQDAVARDLLLPMVKSWKQEATPDQLRRYEVELAKRKSKAPAEDDEPEPTVKARTGAKKGGKG